MRLFVWGDRRWVRWSGWRVCQVSPCEGSRPMVQLLGTVIPGRGRKGKRRGGIRRLRARMRGRNSVKLNSWPNHGTGWGKPRVPGCRFLRMPLDKDIPKLSYSTGISRGGHNLWQLFIPAPNFSTFPAFPLAAKASDLTAGNFAVKAWDIVLGHPPNASVVVVELCISRSAGWCLSQRDLIWWCLSQED